MRSTWPLVHGCLILVSRCSMPFSRQRIVEHVRHVSCRRAVRVARREGELDAVVGENGVDFVGNGRDQGFEEGRGRRPLPVFLTSCTKANLLVRSMAT